MECINLLKDNTEVMSEWGKLSKTKLLDAFIEEIKKSGIYDIKIDTKSSSLFNFLTFKRDGETFEIALILKNVSSAGWAEKPRMKRVQVSNIAKIQNDELYLKLKKKVILLVGYYNYDDNPILVSWNIDQYKNHNTIRSCYVTVDSMKIAYSNNYYDGINANQKVWIYKGELFFKFLNEYVIYGEKE